MKYELLCQNSVTGVAYDITTLAGTIKHDTYLNGQPGKLTVTLQQDPTPNSAFNMKNGSIITFTVDGMGIFYGYVFTMGTDATGIYQITAYDQMRYLKNKQIYLTANQTASQIFEMVCKDNYQDSQWEVATPSAHIPPAYDHTGKTLYETISYAIEATTRSGEGVYFIKDKFGVLQFTSLTQELTNQIIGEGSLLTSYQYEISIDKNTYNSIIFYQDNEETGKRKPWLAQDSSTQKIWGKLQIVQQADISLNEAQLRVLGDQYLKYYNRETKTMKLTALGIPELVAGSGFIFQLDKLGVNEKMWITSANHTYEENFHMMALEVFNPMLEL